MKLSFLKLILPILLSYLLIQILYFLFYNPPGFVLPLTWDKLGYYLYLPSAFIYHDMLHLGFIPEMMRKYELSGYFYQAHIGQTGNYVFSYTLGLAILELPFFCLGHLAAHILGYPPDGFSLPYQFCITLGGTFYSMIGIWYLYRVLRHFFTETISIITILIVVFSTNYFYYSVFENGMTHSYLFTLYAAALYYTMLWQRDHYLSQAIKLGFVMGLAILIRPSEILIILIPLLWGISDKPSAIAKFHLLLGYYRQLLVMCTIMIPIALLQIVYWKYASGHWLYNSYCETGQHFDFGRPPQLLKGFFSIRKGWFVYTPVMLLSMYGLSFIHKESKQMALGILTYTLLNIYVVFSWPMWYYGGSFGCRALVQSYAILALPMGIALKSLLSLKYGKKFTWIFIILATILNLFQTLQYAKGMLKHYRSLMLYLFSSFW